MRKLIITFEYPPQVGGIASYVHQFVNQLPKEDVVVLAPKHNGAKEFDGQENIHIIRKNLLFFPIIWPRWIRLIWQVWKIVKKEKIDIIYLHHVLPVGYVAWIMKKIKKIPFLIFSHGTDIEYATVSAWKRKMMKIITKEAEQIVFNSQNLKHRLLKIMPELESKSSVLYPCPDSLFFQLPDLNEIQKLKFKYALEGKKVILTVSRFDEGKGFPHLIRIMPRLLGLMPHLVWFIIGDGPKKALILDMIQKNSLQNIVRFLGEIPHAELNKFFHLADLFVLLTHPDEGREEGLGLVFLEAAAAGLPIIAGKSGGVEEAVLHAQTGIVVDIHQGDNVIVDSIYGLFQNQEYAKQLGTHAKERVKSQFQWKHQMEVIKKWI